MGLASALSTSLTGLAAAETTIDVVGNNLANSNTVGFKSSSAVFATQFLQTQSLGSKPTDTNAGTNPRQIGLGTMVGAITPDFTQGTIEISTNSMNMAIQGDGFFIVQGSAGEQLYTRNGIFSLNSGNQLTTITGNRVLGYGVDPDYNIDATQLVPLTINLGGDVVAEATENVYLEGMLPPDSDNISTDSQITQSAALGNDTYTRPVEQTTGVPPVSITPTATEAPTPSRPAPAAETGGSLADGTTYYYRITYANYADGTTDPSIAWADESSYVSESLASGIPADITEISFTADASALPDPLQSCSIALGDIPDGYTNFRIYRTTVLDPTSGQPTDFEYLGETTANTTFTDDGTVAPGDPLQPQTAELNGNYSYYVTFIHPTQAGIESRPSDPIPANISTDGRILLNYIPVPEADSQWLDGNEYTMKIYRNTASDPNSWYEVATMTDCDITDPPTFTDRLSDEAIQEAGDLLDFNGPEITLTTRLVDVIRQTGTSASPKYENMFDIPAGSTGTLVFTPKKGGNLLSAKELTITQNTTVQELLVFMQQATGIVTPPGPDISHPIPNDAETGSAPGVSLVNGQIKIVSNTGAKNAIDIALSSMSLEVTGITGSSTVQIPFTTSQTANGTGAMTDFIAYDSLGTPIQVRLTFELESCNSANTTYRWYADSSDNQPTDGVGINCGTGLISFDGDGNLTSFTEATVTIYRNNVPAVSPLEFELDFSSMKALSSSKAEAAVTSQDGSAPGTLTSFIIGEDGIIRGVYSNGVTRDLGQIRLARFANPEGLIQKGENLYTTGVNSGEAVEGNPGEQGIGSIVAGAVELSNTDIGANLIDLILASTMYRGNSRVITTTQEMFDELLNLQR